MALSILHRRATCALALVAAGLCAGHVACSREPTAVIVAVTTDMVVDGDLDELGLYVGVAGEIKTSLRTPTSANQPAKLPGTLSILQPSDASTPIHVRVAGYKNGSLKVVRDAITTVPSGQLSLLRVPLSWLASTHKPAGAGPTTQTAGAAGNVKIRAVPGDNAFSEFDSFFPGYVSPCAQGQTSADGECVDATAVLQKISSGDLVREVYGGALGVDGNGVAEGGTCFDVEECFANEQTLKEADYQNCKVTIPAGLSGPKTVNFAVVRNDATGCTGKACFAPLDWDGKYDEGTSTFTFAPQVCKRIGAADKTIASTRIAVATNCDAKMASRPRCNGLFGAVRDKAPSDPNRAPYYSNEPRNPNDGAPIPLPDGSVPDSSKPDAGPPPPVLLAKLSQVSNPRKLAIANDRLWVRGKVGLGFLDSRGSSTPSEIAALPTLVSTSPIVDDGNRPTSVWAIGNTACVANHGYSDLTNGGGHWCYDLGVLAASAASPGGLAGFIGSGTTFTKVPLGESIEIVYPPSASGSGQFTTVDSAERMVGMATAPGGRAAFAFSSGILRVTDGVFPPSGQLVALSFLALTPPAFREPTGGAFAPVPKRIELATNATEAFFIVGATVGPRTGLFRRKFADAAPTEAALVTEMNLPYTNTTDTAQAAADANYVYWGGGAAGPMAISTCTARAVTAKALFPTAGAQDNTTYAVARAGTKLFFATNDGRVYSMDPPAAEPCP